MSARPSSELWTAETAAAADRHTMDHLGIPSPLLMERAALCVAHEVAALRRGTGLPVVALCGPGNNGGDGLAMCRHLFGWEIPAHAVLVPGRHNATVAEQLALCRGYGVTVAEQLPGGPALVVDALLGTGSRGAPRGAVATMLAQQAAVAGPRVAVDLPTGLDADTGAVHPEAVRADLTVTFVRAKVGLVVTPGRQHAGRVVVADIGLHGPPDRDRRQTLVDPGWVARVLSRLPAGAHKGQRGHVGVVGGSRGTPGAAVLAGAGALRGGAGLCTVAGGDADLGRELTVRRPELMVTPASAPLSPEQTLPRADALCVGPGLTDPADRVGLAALWSDDDRPAVYDAGALDDVPLMCADRAQAGSMAGPRVITPHPGEAGRLLSRHDPSDPWSSGRVQQARLDAVRRLAACTGAVVVLKGEGTLVGTPAKDGAPEAVHVHVVPSGGPALATAGSGDVLAGLIAALLARGLTAPVAAAVGAYVHGVAGERLDVGAVAMDVADALPLALGHVQSDAGRVHPRWPTLRRG
ncbi:MAG: NAD(P)H-hydrate dehydratase [Myxococcota bacterium]